MDKVNPLVQCHKRKGEHLYLLPYPEDLERFPKCSTTVLECLVELTLLNDFLNDLGPPLCDQGCVIARHGEVKLGIRPSYLLEELLKEFLKELLKELLEKLLKDLLEQFIEEFLKELLKELLEEVLEELLK
ncbi:hypothetical protein HGM15179_008946 [Zosterops borbonicus]|uniref:Uncharacterized protein n=1 Tax=Zosterops borbonicus TaxID=364589 RepID=A0A8K1GG41_9PASS|nr:hypothetical protein HGM15179_008946 [Zosterops borbonicus]